MKIKHLLLFLLLWLPAMVQAQPGQTNAELANQYLGTEEYDKALVYFDKYYDQDPFSAYGGFLQCLLKVKDYDKAEKLIKKHQRKFPQDPW